MHKNFYKYHNFQDVRFFNSIAFFLLYCQVVYKWLICTCNENCNQSLETALEFDYDGKL